MAALDARALVAFLAVAADAVGVQIGRRGVVKAPSYKCSIECHFELEWHLFLEHSRVHLKVRFELSFIIEKLCVVQGVGIIWNFIGQR